jgi:hypothetical protein
MKIIARVGKRNSGQTSYQDAYFIGLPIEMSIQEVLDILHNGFTGTLFLSFIESLNDGLHPTEQRELIETIKALDSEATLICTTNSPYILDGLSAENVEVWSKCQYKLLSEHPDISWLSQTLTSGEIWDAEGEEWIHDTL